MKHRKNILFKNVLPLEEELTDLLAMIRTYMGKNNRKEHSVIHAHPYTQEDWYDKNVREFLKTIQEEAKSRNR